MTIVSTEQTALSVWYKREQMAAQCSVNGEQSIITAWYQQRVDYYYRVI
jgi:hypothetical protein